MQRQRLSVDWLWLNIQLNVCHSNAFIQLLVGWSYLVTKWPTLDGVEYYLYLPHKLPSGKPLNLEISFFARNDSEPDEQQRKAGYYWVGPQLDE